MAGWKRRILGITVISAGVCAALPFRNETMTSPVDPRGTSELPDSPIASHDLTLQLTIPTNPTPVPAAIGTQQVAAPDVEKPSPQLQQVRRDELQTPPTIASTFQPLAATLPVATEDTPPISTSVVEPDRRHRIADGDTLEALAERYLGNRDEWPAIYNANSGLLTDREVLPIGAEITIPSTAIPSRDDGDHLVPIPAGLLSREEQ